MISKILIPTDGSEVAHMAARYGLDLAKQLKASVIVLSVIDQRSYLNNFSKYPVDSAIGAVRQCWDN